jgi:hypothetical protein
MSICAGPDRPGENSLERAMVTRRLAFSAFAALAFLGCHSAHLDQPNPYGDVEIQAPNAPVLILSDPGSPRRSVIPVKISNRASTPMTLSLVNKSCNCIEVRLPKQPVAGGDSATVELVATSGVGERRLGFTVACAFQNGPAIQKSIELTASVYPHQEAVPRALVSALAASAADRVMVIYRMHTAEVNPKPADHKIEVTKLPAIMTLESIRPRGVRSLGSGVSAMEWELAFRCQEQSLGDPSSARHGQFEIHCDSLAPLNVPFHFTRLGDVAVSPDVIYFDETPIGRHADRFAVVHVGGTEAVSIPTVSSSQPDFSIESMETVPPATVTGPRMLRIKLRFSPRNPGVRRSEITLSFSVPEKRVARIITTGRGV